MHPHYKEITQDAHNELKRVLPSVYAMVKQYPQSHWNWFYAYKLIELSDWLMFYMPKRILEFGSGWSTLLFARHVAEFGGEVFTVEETDEYIEQTKQKLGAWGKVHWHKAGTVIKNKLISYKSLPDVGAVDLLYVDGPSSTKADITYTGDDAVTACIRYPVKHVLFDWRHTSVDLFKEFAGLDWEYYKAGSYPGKRGLLWRQGEMCRHHSWFRRK